MVAHGEREALHNMRLGVAGRSLVVASLCAAAGALWATAAFAVDADPAKEKAEVDMGPLADLDILWKDPQPPDESDVLLLERANNEYKTSEFECAFTLYETNGRESWSQYQFDPRTTPQWRVLATSDPQADQPDGDESDSEKGEQESSAGEGEDEDPSLPSLPDRRPTVSFLDELDRFFQGEGTLSILQERESLTVFGLVPDVNGKGVAKHLKKMRPRIVIVVSHGRPMIEATDLSITKTFSPQFGIRITDWRVTEISEYNEATESVVVTYRSAAMKGRALRVVPIRQTTMQWYDDFTC